MDDVDSCVCAQQFLKKGNVKSNISTVQQRGAERRKRISAAVIEERE